MKLEEATILALNGKLNETKLVETDTTPEFLNDLKNLINNHMRVSNIKDIVVEKKENGNEIAIITFENGSIVKIDITAESNLAATRSILNAIA